MWTVCYFDTRSSRKWEYKYECFDFIEDVELLLCELEDNTHYKKCDSKLETVKIYPPNTRIDAQDILKMRVKWDHNKKTYVVK